MRTQGGRKQAARWRVGLADQYQVETPPWCEQVPLRCALYESEPSRHMAVAPEGFTSGSAARDFLVFSFASIDGGVSRNAGLAR